MCEPRLAQCGVCGWGIHCAVYCHFEGQPVRPGVVGVVCRVFKTFLQCQLGRWFRFWCEILDSVCRARGVPLCYPPGVLVAC